MDCSRPSSKMWNAERSRPFTGLPSSLTTTSTTTRLEAVRMAGPLDCGAASLDCGDGALAGCGAGGAGSCADMAMANTRHCASAMRKKERENLMPRTPTMEDGGKNRSKGCVRNTRNLLQSCAAKKQDHLLTQ